MKFTNRLAVVQVRLGSHISMTINLSDTEQAVGPTLASTGFPSTALELISSDGAPSKAPFSTTLPLGEVGNRLRRALAVFPTGDEVLANQWERSDPRFLDRLAFSTTIVQMDSTPGQFTHGLDRFGICR